MQKPRVFLHVRVGDAAALRAVDVQLLENGLRPAVPVQFQMEVVQLLREEFPVVRRRKRGLFHLHGVRGTREDQLLGKRCRAGIRGAEHAEAALVLPVVDGDDDHRQAAHLHLPLDLRQKIRAGAVGADHQRVAAWHARPVPGSARADLLIHAERIGQHLIDRDERAVGVRRREDGKHVLETDAFVRFVEDHVQQVVRVIRVRRVEKLRPAQRIVFVHTAVKRGDVGSRHQPELLCLAHDDAAQMVALEGDMVDVAEMLRDRKIAADFLFGQKRNDDAIHARLNFREFLLRLDQFGKIDGVVLRFHTIRFHTDFLLAVHSMLSALRIARGFGKNFVDQTVFLRLLGRHEAVARGVRQDALRRLPGVCGEETVEPLAGGRDARGGDLDVVALPARAAAGLVDHDLAVRQREAPVARRQQHSAHARGLSHTEGVHGMAALAHHVVDGEPRR